MSTPARLAGALAFFAAAALASTEAGAVRPTSGGIWAFAPDDEVEHFEDASGRVRVHYSVAGPSVTRLDDLDTDGVPDYVTHVAAVALESLELYAQLGFRPPVSELELELGPLGGSEALDLYLVDFQGSADGLFSVDGCTSAPRHCAGWIALENDFFGYSYPTLDAALDTVVVHELFHAVQAAYDGAQPVWFSEGTAVWAHRMFWPQSHDFIGKCDAYLELIDRPIDKPPAGPVQSFSYGTALFWWFLHVRLDGAVDVALQLASQSPDGQDVDLVAGVAAALEDADDSLSEAWFAFAKANLATGPRAGAYPGAYEFAAQLDGITATEEGPFILHDEVRFQPLSARYFRLDHSGGLLAAVVDTVHEELRFSLHPVVGGAADGPVEAAAIEWRADTLAAVELGDYPAGGYWVVGTLPIQATSSAKTAFCIGGPEDVGPCQVGDGETGETGDEPETGGGESETGSDAETATGLDESGGSGCSCSTDEPAHPDHTWLSLLALPFLRRRRRRSVPRPIHRLSRPLHR